MLVRPRRIAEVWWACAGAFLLIATGLVTLPQAAHAIREGLDVYLFLAGMMILAELAREEGVFDWAAGIAAGHARGSSRRLFFLIYCVGIAVTALLSNDATAVVLTPAVLAVVRRANVRPRPYLLACAFIANAASFVFPISNPANLVVFGRQIPPLADWLGVFLLPSLASIVVTFGCLYWCEHKDLQASDRGRTTARAADHRRQARAGWTAFRRSCADWRLGIRTPLGNTHVLRGANRVDRCRAA